MRKKRDQEWSVWQIPLVMIIIANEDQYMDSVESKKAEIERREHIMKLMAEQRDGLFEYAIHEVKAMALPEMVNAEVEHLLTQRMLCMIVQAHSRVTDRDVDRITQTLMDDYDMMKGILNNLYHERYVTAGQYAQILTHLQDVRAQVMEWKRNY